MKMIIMAGGTGGHIFPALAVADELKARKVTVHWLGSKNGMEQAIVEEAGYPFHALNVVGLRRHRWHQRLVGVFKLGIALMQALITLLRLKPDVVLGMGGYASGPGAIAAYLCRIPLVIHEQNAILGTTNRLLQSKAAAALSAFPNTFPPECPLANVTGNPVRNNLITIPVQIAQPGDRLHLLVVGGSQGARFLNQLLPETLAQIKQDLGNPWIEVWHITGVNEYESTLEHYKTALGPAALKSTAIRIEPFCKNMEKAYHWATMALCRAGAMTVSELAVVGLPAILVPYPYAVDDHQTANANYLAQAGGAVLIQQSELTKERLVEQLMHFHTHPDALNTMGQKAKDMGLPYAAQTVANTMIQLS